VCCEKLTTSGYLSCGFVSVAAINFTNTAKTDIVANKMLRMAQVGDLIGESGITVMNRGGFNGAVVYTNPTSSWPGTYVTDVILATGWNASSNAG
jgi:hypothetical protein